MKSRRCQWYRVFANELTTGDLGSLLSSGSVATRATDAMIARRFVRFQAVEANRHGGYPGVFGLVNGLARAGRLSAEQERSRRAGNDWYNANLIDPAAVDSAVYDRAVHPGAAAWFKSSAVEMIERVGGYLAILDAHEVRWERLESDAPGEIVYDDPYQVVVRSRSTADGAV